MNSCAPGQERGRNWDATNFPIGGLFYHVLNRANGIMRMFHDPADLEAFQRGWPFGSYGWILQTAARLKMEHTLRPVGLPERAATPMKIRNIRYVPVRITPVSDLV
jgi:hypothetical protein